MNPIRNLLLAMVFVSCGIFTALGAPDTPAPLILAGQSIGVDSTDFGDAVALGENYILVHQRTQNGTVYVYAKNDGAYLGAIQAPDRSYDTPAFGWSIGETGKYIFVGSPFTFRVGAHDGTGYIFKRGQSGAFEMTNFWSENPSQWAAYFGITGGLFGDLLISAQGSNTGWNSKGMLFFYAFDAKTGAKSLIKSVVENISGIAPYRVAEGGGKVACFYGASPKGEVRLFNIVRDANGVPSGIDLSQTIPAESGAGVVAVSEKYLAVGSMDQTLEVGGVAYANSGQVNVYRNQGGTYVLMGTLRIPNPSPEARFGCSLALLGDRLFVGARGVEPTEQYARGAVFTYDLNALGDPVAVQRADKTPGNGGELFGSSLAVRGGKMVVGTTGSLDQSTQGSVYVFSGPAYEESTPFNPLSDSSLLAYYPFAGDFKDKTLKAPDAIARNNVVFETDEKFAQVTKVVGAGWGGSQGGHIEIPKPQLKTENLFTASFWLREDAMSDSAGESYLAAGAGRGNRMLVGHLWGTGYNTEGGSKTVPPDSITGKWHHYTYVSSVQSGTLYVDGETCLSVPLTGTPDGNWFIGRHWWNNGYEDSTRLIGAVSKFRIYDRALSSEEVALLYRADLPSGAVMVSPNITTQPQAVSVSVGAAASFGVNVTGTNPLTYQWRKDGLNILGGTSATFSLLSAQLTDAGSYSVLVSNAAGSVTSDRAKLIVNSGSSNLAVLNQMSVRADIDIQSVLQISPLGVRWENQSWGNRPGTLDGSGYVPTTINGSDWYTVWPDNNTRSVGYSSYADFKFGFFNTPVTVQVLDSRMGNSFATIEQQPSLLNNYTLRVSLLDDRFGGSAWGSIRINSVAPVDPVSITGQPTPMTVTAGSLVSFSVSATGGGSLSYQWRKDGANIQGGTSATYSIPSAQPADGGIYSVLVKNEAGSLTSLDAKLTVLSPIKMTWNDFAGTYEGLLEDISGSPAEDGAAYRGAFTFTLTKTGAVSGRLSYNEAIELGGPQRRVYSPVTRSFSGFLSTSVESPLEYRKVIKFGSGSGRQTLTVSVSFDPWRPLVTVSVKDFVSPGDGGDAWESQALACERIVSKLPAANGTDDGGLDFSRVAGNYTLFTRPADSFAEEASSAYFLLRVTQAGKVLWMSRIKGSVGSGSAGLRMTLSGMEAAFYEGHAASFSKSLKTLSLIGNLNFIWDAATSSWGARFGSPILPDKLEKQFSCVSRIGGKLVFTENDPSNASGVSLLDYSREEGIRWEAAATLLKEQGFLRKSSGPLVLRISAAVPSIAGDSNLTHYDWTVSVSATGKVSTTPQVNGDGLLSPKLSLALDKQRGELTGSFVTNSADKAIRCNLYGCFVTSKESDSLRASGWLELGGFSTLPPGEWEINTDQ